MMLVQQLPIPCIGKTTEDIIKPINVKAVIVWFIMDSF